DLLRSVCLFVKIWRRTRVPAATLGARQRWTALYCYWARLKREGKRSNALPTIEVSALTQRERRPARPQPFVWRALVALAALPVLSSPSIAHADPTQFNVPEQSLGAALRQIADQAGAQVLLPAGLTDGLRSRPVHGRLELLQALRSAIGKSNLEVE